MFKLSESTLNDVEQLTEWIKNDPYHKDCLNPGWWLTGKGALSFVIQDYEGPTMYVRTDIEGAALRIHIQFAPKSEVSPVRVVKSLIKGFPAVVEFAKSKGCIRLVYNSTSPSLIQFLQKQLSFVPTGDDDYVRSLVEETD